jgi:hypothetical protein
MEPSEPNFYFEIRKQDHWHPDVFKCFLMPMSLGILATVKVENDVNRIRYFPLTGTTVLFLAAWRGTFGHESKSKASGHGCPKRQAFGAPHVMKVN